LLPALFIGGSDQPVRSAADLLLISLIFKPGEAFVPPKPGLI